MQAAIFVLVVCLILSVANCALLSVTWPGTKVVELNPTTGAFTPFGELKPATLTWYQSTVVGDNMVLLSCDPDSHMPKLGVYNTKAKTFKSTNVTGTPKIVETITCFITANPMSNTEVYLSMYRNWQPSSPGHLPRFHETTVYSLNLATATAKQLGIVSSKQIINTGSSGSWVDPSTMTLTLLFSEYVNFPFGHTDLNVVSYNLKTNTGKFYKLGDKYHLPTGFGYSASQGTGVGLLQTFQHSNKSNNNVAKETHMTYVAKWDTASNAFQIMFEVPSVPASDSIGLYTSKPVETLRYIGGDDNGDMLVSIDIKTKLATKVGLLFTKHDGSLYDLLEVPVSTTTSKF